MAGGLFHYKLDKSDDRAYSLKKEDYPRLPLFDPNAPAPKRRYLNEVFLLVLDNIPTWRSMSATYAVDAPKARNSSVRSEDEEEAKDSGEEGPIGGSAPDLE